MMIKLKMISLVMDLAMASTRQIIEERNILDRNFQGGALLGSPKKILKIILKRRLRVRLIGYKADNRGEVIQNRV